MLPKNATVFTFLLLLCGLILAATPAPAQFNAFKDPGPGGSAASQEIDFHAVAPTIQGGKVAVGATAYVVVMFKNQGSSSVKIGTVNLYPSSTVTAQIALNQCADADLPTDAQCAMTIAVMGRQSGSWRVEVLVNHEGRSKVATASITGDVEQVSTKQEQVAKGDLEITPPILDFGTSSGGISLMKSVTLNNHTAEAIKIKGVFLNVPEGAGFSYKSQCPETLQPEETCGLIVNWAPTSKGLAQGVLAIQHSGKSAMVQTALTGTLQPEAVGAPAENSSVILSPETMDFGTTDGGIAQMKSIVLSNQSSGSINIGNIFLKTPEGSGLSYESQCPLILPGKGSCTIVMTWKPTVPGLSQGVLIAQHSGKGGMTQTEVKGTFIPRSGSAEKSGGDITISPESLDFGTTAGGIDLVKSVVLKNGSAKNVDIRDIGISASGRSGFSYKSECPPALAPEEMCNIIVTWSPRARGLTQGVLVVHHSGRSSLVQAEVKGSRTPATVTSATFYPDDVSDKGLLVADREKIDFGSGVKEGAAITLSLVNTGSSSVTLNDIKVSGLNKGLSILDAGCVKGTVLAAGDACPITINWLPGRIGPLLDSLQIFHTGSRGILVIPITGSADVAVKEENKIESVLSGTIGEKGGDDASSADGGPKSGVSAEVINELEKFTITSLSTDRAVINSAAGGFVVRNGEQVMILGGRWAVTIVPTGVILTRDKKEVELTFDRSLRAVLALNMPAAQAGAAVLPAAAVPRTTPPPLGGIMPSNEP